MTDLPDIVQVQRAKGHKSGLHAFVKMAWHLYEPARPFVDNWHLGAVCEHLEAFHARQIRDLVITMPPGCSKSSIANVFFPAWAWIKRPEYRTIYASYDQALVGKRDGGKTIDLVTSDWYQARWPVHFRTEDMSAYEFHTTSRGFRYATSIKGKVTGQHANAFIVDDPHKPQTMTKESLDDDWNWYKETARTRVFPGDGFVCIMQRLHAGDMAQHFLDLGFEHLNLPMRYEGANAKVTSIGFRDPRTKERELLWPAYKTEEVVAADERVLGERVVAAQFQQRPSPEGGAVFKRDWVKYYTVAPGQFDVGCISLDCSFKDEAGSDYVALWEGCRRGADFYLTGLHVERLDFPGTLHLFTKRAKARPKYSAKLIEDKANGSAIISMTKRKIPGVIAIEPEGGKEARANAVAPLYEAGNVYYPDPAGAILDPAHDDTPTKLAITWDGRPASIEAHVESMLGFPFAAHDDDVDAETQALNYLRTRSRWLENMRKIAGR